MVDAIRVIVAVGLVSLGGMAAAQARPNYYGRSGDSMTSPYGYGYAPYHSGFSGSGGSRPFGSRGGP